MPDVWLMACHECDLIQRVRPPDRPGKVRCRRCDGVLLDHKAAGLDRPIALYLAGAVFFLLANCFPFLALKFEGLVQETTLVSGVIELYRQKMPGLALLVGLTTIGVPFVELAGMLWVLLPVRWNRPPRHVTVVFRIILRLQTWSMLEVFMLGILVAVVKLADMATIIPGIGVYCFGVLIFILAAAAGALDRQRIWNSLVPPLPAPSFLPPQRPDWVSCHDCRLLCHVPAGALVGHAICPRCRSPLHVRKLHSLSRTWALIVAAAILYIPANVLPIMSTVSLGDERTDTILSGVIYLIVNGMWPLALVVFVASIFVPLLKLVILTVLMVSVQIKSTWKPKDRTRLYRITETVGRWSMVDIYVVSILVALVKMGALSTVGAEAGAAAFGAVVVLTILAALTFDPRLIWDAMERRHD
jgi:paraquat-inducible protein A